MARRIGCCLVALVVATVETPLWAAKLQPQTLSSRGRDRSFFLHVPGDLDPAEPRPLLVVLHGSGHDGSSLVKPWRKLADARGFLVVGPDALDPEVWRVPVDGPRFLYDLVEHLKQSHPIDPRRVYLFGHSAGASFGLQIALLESRYFAAAAVHAGLLQEQDSWLIDGAERKIPIHVAIGTRDPLMPLARVRQTRDSLERRGIPVDFVEMPFHDHGYYDTAAKINRRAWEFLERHTLPGEPHYERHSFLP